MDRTDKYKSGKLKNKQYITHGQASKQKKQKKKKLYQKPKQDDSV